MRKPSLWTGVLGAAIALTMVARPAFAVEETKIGVTSASNLTTTGFPPVSPEHLLKIGVEVVGDERIITTKDGRAQLLFLDHSALTVGPNSNLVLDKFVYDPDAGVGELAFSATKGIFRLVGGRISKKTPVTIKTFSGTIGIRGGIAMVSIQEGGPVEATFLFGKDMTVESEGQVVTATRPGSLVTFSPGNILDPVILTADQISATVQQLEQTPGKITDSAVFVFQQEVKDAALGALAEPAAGLSPAPPPPAPPTDPSVNTGDIISDSTEESVSEEIAAGTPPTAITLDNDTVPENQSGAVIGALSVSDPDAGDSHTFTFSDGRFEIVGGQLKLKAGVSLDFEAEPPVTLDVTATDSKGLTIDVPFTITVTNVCETIFCGRAKRAVSAGGFAGTGDLNPALNIPSDATRTGSTSTGGTFDFSLRPGQQLTINVAPGDVDFAATSTTTPFTAGILTGDGFLTADGEFVAYELTDQGDGRDVLVWAGVPTPASAFPASGATFYELEPDFVLKSNVPFINGSTPGVSAGGLTISEPVEAIIDWDLGLFGGAAIVIDGAGTSQESVASVFFGPLVGLGDPQTADIAGLIRGGWHRSANDTRGVVGTSNDQFRLARDGGGPPGPPTGNGFFGTTNPDYFVLEADGTIPVISETFETGGARFNRGYSPNIIAVALDPPDVLGPRTDRTLNGFAGGLSRRLDSAGNVIGHFMFINTPEDGSGITIQTDAATGTLTAIFDVQEIDAAGNDNRLVASFGGAQRSAYFDDDAFGAFESGTPAQFGTVPPDPAVTGTNLYMVTSEAFQSNNFPGAASECACQFLEWGFWGGEIRFAGGESERIHLANWIAGDNIAAGIDLPTVGTATYNGHLIGTVLNAGAVYQAMGGFGMTFDFANPTASTINVNSFDGVNYNANVVNLANGIYFAVGQDASAVLGRDIFFEGAFFGGGGDPVAETGGNFDIDGGPDYTASGIFAGAK